MQTDSVRCRVDILVVDGKLEEALDELRMIRGGALRELRKRRRQGPLNTGLLVTSAVQACNETNRQTEGNP